MHFLPLILPLPLVHAAPAGELVRARARHPGRLHGVPERVLLLGRVHPGVLEVLRLRWHRADVHAHGLLRGADAVFGDGHSPGRYRFFFV